MYFDFNECVPCGAERELRDKLERAGIGIVRIDSYLDGTFVVEAILEGSIIVRGTEEEVLKQLGVPTP